MGSGFQRNKGDSLSIMKEDKAQGVQMLVNQNMKSSGPMNMMNMSSLKLNLLFGVEVYFQTAAKLIRKGSTTNIDQSEFHMMQF